MPGIVCQSSFPADAKFCNSELPLCLGCAVPVGVACGDALLHQGVRRARFVRFCWPHARSPAAP
jgi:hypothetical protein